MVERIRSFLSGRKHEEYNPDAAAYAQGIINSQAPESAEIQRARADLDINIHTIVDEGVINTLEELQIIPERKYMIYLDKEGNIVSQDMEHVSEKEIYVPPQPVPWALALRVAVSKVSATRFITAKNAVLYKNRMRNEFLKIKRSMTREERENFIAYVNQIELQCLEAIDDSVDGQKMLALKTSGKHLRVGVQTGNVPGGK